MIAFLLTIFISFIATTFFGYVVHWSLHQSWAGRFNQSHMTHHLKLYPPEDYTSDTYRSAGKDNTVITFAVASLPMIAFPIVLGLFGIIGWFLVATALFVELSLGFLHWYIHDAFHIKNHWMSRVPWLKDIFQVWNGLHYTHHVDMGTNYGIFVFHWDRLFKTFRSE